VSKPSAELSALRNLISEAETLLATTKLPENRSKRALELLRAAVALTNDLLTAKPSRARKSNPAVELGAKGGKKTAERGPEYFAAIAAMRKTKGGGRPKKATAS
jgi:hypothetical protein